VRLSTEMSTGSPQRDALWGESPGTGAPGPVRARKNSLCYQGLGLPQGVRADLDPLCQLWDKAPPEAVDKL